MGELEIPTDLEVETPVDRWQPITLDARTGTTQAALRRLLHQSGTETKCGGIPPGGLGFRLRTRTRLRL